MWWVCLLLLHFHRITCSDSTCIFYWNACRHPTTDFKTCSNSKDHPGSWLVAPGYDLYMHATYNDCCSEHFKGKHCPKEDVCNPVACEDQIRVW
jgi:hypothetical protein